MKLQTLLAFSLAAGTSLSAFALGTNFAPTTQQVLPMSSASEPIDLSASQWILGSASTYTEVWMQRLTPIAPYPVTGPLPEWQWDHGSGGLGQAASAQAEDLANDVHAVLTAAPVAAEASGARFEASFGPGRQAERTYLRYLIDTQRSFQLAAGDSVSFTGQARFDLPANMGQIVASNTFDQRDESDRFPTITLGNPAGSVATQLSIRLDVPGIGSSALPDLDRYLSYAVDASSGFMSITVTNTGPDLLKGAFFSHTAFEGWSSVSPVPEPPVSALMLTGLALMAFGIRRGQASMGMAPRQRSGFDAASCAFSQGRA